MAQIGSLGTFYGYSNSDTQYGGYYVYFTYSASGTTLSSMSVKLEKINSGGSYTTNTAYLDSVKIGGTSYSFSPTSISMVSGQTPVRTLTYNLSGTYTASGSSVGVEIKMHRSGQSGSAQTFTGTVTGLATAPTGLSCSVSSIFENYANVSGSYTSNGGASVTASGLQYSTNNSSWSAYTSGSSGTALSPNTTYYFRYYATNIVGTSYSNSVSAKTYQYPYVSAVETSSLTIGNSQKLTLYNPLGRSVSVYMKKNTTSGTTLYSGSTSSTSITFTPTASTLYNSIPSSQSGDAVYYCTYSSHTIQTLSGTYKIKGNEKPNFTSNNFTYSTDYSSLTGNHSTIIKGMSTATFNITSAGTSSYGATISKYVLIWSGVSNITSTTTGTMTISGGIANTITLRCYDSRNLYTDVVTTFSFVNYASPTISGSTKRKNGIGEDVTLSLNGSIYFEKFGPNGITNEISSMGYRCSTTTEFSGDYINISPSMVTYGTGSGTARSWSITDMRIYLDGATTNFTIGTKYYVQVYVRDSNEEFAESIAVVTITDGKIAVDTFKDDNNNYHSGFNGLASNNYNLQVGGSFNANGDIYRNEIKIEQYIADVMYPFNSIYINLTDELPSFLVGEWEQYNTITSNGTTYYVFRRKAIEKICVNDEDLLYDGENIYVEL